MPSFECGAYERKRHTICLYFIDGDSAKYSGTYIGNVQCNMPLATVPTQATRAGDILRMAATLAPAYMVTPEHPWVAAMPTLGTNAHPRTSPSKSTSKGRGALRSDFINKRARRKEEAATHPPSTSTMSVTLCPAVISLSVQCQSLTRNKLKQCPNVSATHSTDPSALKHKLLGHCTCPAPIPRQLLHALLDVDQR